jgi:hypothetical protein
LNASSNILVSKGFFRLWSFRALPKSDVIANDAKWRRPPGRALLMDELAGDPLEQGPPARHFYNGPQRRKLDPHVF